ncbi:MAG: alpha/beta hydrolase [Myxococcales bacterium]|nr:alpha/beta hydrolase [Myxococcales bacterium]
MARQQLPHAVVDGSRIVYSESGSGPPLLMLHGYPQNHRAWRHQQQALSRTRRVIVPDWLGWGDSDRNLQLSVDFEAEVARVAAFLDVLGLERVDLAGHDYGGLLALGFVQRYPDRVASLVILNSRAHRTFPGMYYWVTAVVGVLARSRALRWLLWCAPLYSIHRLGFARFIRRRCFDAELVESYIGVLRGPGKRWWVKLFADYELKPIPELGRRLAEIRCKTLLLWGTDDGWCPVAIAEDLAASIPDAELVRIEGADHFVMEERPTDVTRALERFLSSAADHNTQA